MMLSQETENAMARIVAVGTDMKEVAVWNAVSGTIERLNQQIEQLEIEQLNKDQPDAP